MYLELFKVKRKRIIKVQCDILEFNFLNEQMKWKKGIEMKSSEITGFLFNWLLWEGDNILKTQKYKISMREDIEKWRTTSSLPRDFQ